jgi:hypothetical protein
VPLSELAQAPLQLPVTSAILPKSTQTNPMLTVTETVTRKLHTEEKLALDNNIVADNLLKAFESSDKKSAVQYAQILMLKAMTM